MKVQTKTLPAIFQPVELKVTFDTQAEYDIFRVMTARDFLIPQMLEQEGYIDSTAEVTLSRMLQTIRQSLK